MYLSIVFKGFIISTLLTSAAHAVLTDDYSVREVTSSLRKLPVLNVASMEGNNSFSGSSSFIGSYNSEDVTLAQQILQRLQISEDIKNKKSPAEGAHAKTYLTEEHAVKIVDTSPMYVGEYEATAILAIKKIMQENPAQGLDFCLPKIIYKNEVAIDTNDDEDSDQKTQHFFISDRVYAVKPMVDVVKNALLQSGSEDLETIANFGQRVAEFQIGYTNPNQLVDKWDRILSAAHQDLNPNNIFPQKDARFTLIDNSDLILEENDEQDLMSIDVDPIYFLMKSLNYAYENTYDVIGEDDFENLGPITNYSYNFFNGYLKAYNEKMPTNLDAIVKYFTKERNYDKLSEDFMNDPKFHETADEKIYNKGIMVGFQKAVDNVKKGGADKSNKEEVLEEAMEFIKTSHRKAYRQVAAAPNLKKQSKISDKIAMFQEMINKAKNQKTQ